MTSGLSTATDALGEADSLIDQLRDDDNAVWEGDAGNAFGAHYRDTLSVDLYHAHESLGKAVDLLHGWASDLSEFRSRAQSLDSDMADAKQCYAQAYESYQQANQDPALKLAGEFFDDKQALQAQNVYDAAQSRLSSANSRLESAKSDVESIMARAMSLRDQPSGVCDRVAGELKDATNHLAPHKPGMFSRLCHDFDRCGCRRDGQRTGVIPPSERSARGRT